MSCSAPRIVDRQDADYFLNLGRCQERQAERQREELRRVGADIALHGRQAARGSPTHGSLTILEEYAMDTDGLDTTNHYEEMSLQQVQQMCLDRGVPVAVVKKGVIDALVELGGM